MCSTCNSDSPPGIYASILYITKHNSVDIDRFEYV